jgi:hypothetical protein
MNGTVPTPKRTLLLVLVLVLVLVVLVLVLVLVLLRALADDLCLPPTLLSSPPTLLSSPPSLLLWSLPRDGIPRTTAPLRLLSRLCLRSAIATPATTSASMPPITTAGAPPMAL